jgi:ACR3 family arsenite efflux pump ArsB
MISDYKTMTIGDDKTMVMIKIIRIVSFPCLRGWIVHTSTVSMEVFILRTSIYIGVPLRGSSSVARRNYRGIIEIVRDGENKPFDCGAYLLYEMGG